MIDRDKLQTSLYFIYTNLKLNKDTSEYISELSYSFTEQYAAAIEELVIEIIYASRNGGNTIGAVINLTIFILNNIPLDAYSAEYLNRVLNGLNSPAGNYMFTKRMKLLSGLIGISILLCDNCWYAEDRVSTNWRITKKGNLRCVNCDEKEDVVECDECDESLFRLTKKNNLKCEACGEKFDKIYFDNTNDYTENDTNLKSKNYGESPEDSQFIYYLLALMTKMYKSDGPVSHKERDHAVSVLKRFDTSEIDRKRFYSYMNEIKKDRLSFHSHLLKYKNTSIRDVDLDSIMISILLEAAAIDGIFHYKEEELIKLAIKELDIPFHSFDNIKYKVFSQLEKVHVISDYYKLFDCVPGDSLQKVRKSHIELQKKFHPDNYASKDLPEEMIKLAEEKVKELNLAFEVLKDVIKMDK